MTDSTCSSCDGPVVPCACGGEFCYCNLLGHLGHYDDPAMNPEPKPETP